MQAQPKTKMSRKQSPKLSPNQKQKTTAKKMQMTKRHHQGHKIQKAFALLLGTALAFAVIFPATAISKPCVNCPKTQPGLDPYSNGTYNPMGAAGQATTLQGGTGNTVLQVGAESTLLQGGAQGTLLQANIEREGSPANILFLIDSSQS